MAASSYTCAHGHAWTFHGLVCAECDAQRERPHAADPVAARLDPNSALKHWICQQCTGSPYEEIHRAATP